MHSLKVSSLIKQKAIFRKVYFILEHAVAVAYCLSLGSVNLNHWTKSKSCYGEHSIGQSVLVSSPHLGQRPDFYYCQTSECLLMCGALSEMRECLSFTIATDRAAVILRDLSIPK
jgi:hypothetical protein